MMMFEAATSGMELLVREGSLRPPEPTQKRRLGPSAPGSSRVHLGLARPRSPGRASPQHRQHTGAENGLHALPGDRGLLHHHASSAVLHELRRGCRSVAVSGHPLRSLWSAPPRRGAMDISSAVAVQQVLQDGYGPDAHVIEQPEPSGGARSNQICNLPATRRISPRPFRGLQGVEHPRALSWSMPGQAVASESSSADRGSRRGSCPWKCREVPRHQTSRGSRATKNAIYGLRQLAEVLPVDVQRRHMVRGGRARRRSGPDVALLPSFDLPDSGRASGRSTASPVGEDLAQPPAAGLVDAAVVDFSGCGTAAARASRPGSAYSASGGADQVADRLVSEHAGSSSRFCQSWLHLGFLHSASIDRPPTLVSEPDAPAPGAAGVVRLSSSACSLQ